MEVPTACPVQEWLRELSQSSGTIDTMLRSIKQPFLQIQRATDDISSLRFRGPNHIAEGMARPHADLAQLSFALAYPGVREPSSARRMRG